MCRVVLYSLANNWHSGIKYHFCETESTTERMSKIGRNSTFLQLQINFARSRSGSCTDVRQVKILDNNHKSFLHIGVTVGAALRSRAGAVRFLQTTGHWNKPSHQQSSLFADSTSRTCCRPTLVELSDHRLFQLLLTSCVRPSARSTSIARMRTHTRKYILTQQTTNFVAVFQLQYTALDFQRGMV